MIPALEEEEDLARAYRRTLSTFLHSPSEEALTGAYQLGRRALKEGKGVIDWAGVHDRAVTCLDTQPGIVGYPTRAHRRRGARFVHALLEGFDVRVDGERDG